MRLFRLVNPSLAGEVAPIVPNLELATWNLERAKPFGVFGRPAVSPGGRDAIY